MWPLLVAGLNRRYCGECGALWAVVALLLCGYYGAGFAAQIGAYCGYLSRKGASAIGRTWSRIVASVRSYEAQ